MKRADSAALGSKGCVHQTQIVVITEVAWKEAFIEIF